MAKRSPADVIDAYRRRQGRRYPFAFADVSQGLLFLLIIASSVYVALTGGPELPKLVDLKTNTPTYTPSITPTPTLTATITATSTETPDPANQCNCSSPVVIVVTATFEVKNSPVPSATLQLPPSSTSVPTNTPTITETLSPTPTPRLYTVQRNDTLSGIAIRFGVSVEAIQALNNLSNTIIREGQVLQIPSQ